VAGLTFCVLLAMILLDGRIGLLWMRFSIRLDPVVEDISAMCHNAFVATILILPIGADNSLIGTVGTNAFYWARWLQWQHMGLVGRNCGRCAGDLLLLRLLLQMLLV